MIKKALYTAVVFALFQMPIANGGEATEEPTVRETINQYCQAIDTHRDDPDFWYELGLLYREEGDLKRARSSQQKALSVDPNFLKASIELSHLDIDEGNIQQAYASFCTIIANDPCNKEVNSGMERIAHAFEKDEATQHLALSIYTYLLQCMPENCDILLYQGRLLSWMQCNREAEAAFRKGLALCPDYFDIALLLGNLYIRENRWVEAECLLSQFPNELEANVALGRIALLRNCYAQAQGYYERAVAMDPCHLDARRGLAQSLYNRLRFTRAKRNFKYLIANDPCDDLLYKEYTYYVKPHTNFAVVPDFSYTNSKEGDPSVNDYVVRTLYVASNLSILAPITDQWRLDTTGIFFRQREKDIYFPKGTNYDVYMSGIQLTSHLYLCRDLRWDAFAKLIRAWGEGEMFYPFDTRNSFEPGSYLSYNSDTWLFVLGGNYESFVIKNFNTGHSELLRYAYTELRGGYKWDNCRFSPQIQLWAAGNFYRDCINNKRHLEAAWLEGTVPFCNDEITFFWTAEYSGFEKLNINYYTYKRQWLNVIGAKYHKEFSTCSYIDLIYEESFRSARDLYLPVGNTVFVASRLFRRGYRPIVKLGYRYKDKLEMEVGGHYYYDTFPYHDYNVNGSFLWYF